MNVGIVVIFHNEYELLNEQLLPNLRQMRWPKENIVFVDSFFDQMGRWQKPDKSNDGSIELLRDSGYEIRYCINKPMLTCCNTRYNIAKEKGWKALLWLDADEIVSGDINGFLEEVDDLIEKYQEPTRINVPFKDHNLLYDYKQTPQLVIHPEGICQRFMHTLFFNVKTGERLAAKEMVRSITIHHNDSLRPAEKDRINNAFSIVNGRMEKLQLKMALDAKHPWLKDMGLIKNE